MKADAAEVFIEHICKEERKMQEREKAEKRQECCGLCTGNEPTVSPVDLEVDFEGLAMAWKEARESSERRG